MFVLNEALVNGDISGSNAAYVNTLIGLWPYNLFMPNIYK